MPSHSLLVFGLVSVIRGNDTAYDFWLLTSSHSLYRYDGHVAIQISGDEWIVLLQRVITRSYWSQMMPVVRIFKFSDLNGAYQRSLTDFDLLSAPIWTKITYSPSSEYLMPRLRVSETSRQESIRFILRIPGHLFNMSRKAITLMFLLTINSCSTGRWKDLRDFGYAD